MRFVWIIVFFSLIFFSRLSLKFRILPTPLFRMGSRSPIFVCLISFSPFPLLCITYGGFFTLLTGSFTSLHHDSSRFKHAYHLCNTEGAQPLAKIQVVLFATYTDRYHSFGIDSRSTNPSSSPGFDSPGLL